MRDIDLLVVGEINPDIVVTDPDPVPVFGQAERLVEGIRLTIGSSSAITACGAARLGLRVAIVGVVGDDALGRFTLDALAARGVDVSACRVARGRPDRRVGRARQRHRPGDPHGDRARSPTRARPTCRRRCSARARHVHVGSFFLQPGLAADLPALFRAAREGGATTSLDPNWDPAGAWDGGFAAALAETDVAAPERRRGRAG